MSRSRPDRPARGDAAALPPGRLPAIGAAELVAALHRRRAGRLRAVEELRATLELLAASVERRRARIAHLKALLDAKDRDAGA